MHRVPLLVNGQKGCFSSLSSKRSSQATFVRAVAGNTKLQDKLAQVLGEKETLNKELKTIAAEVSEVKSSWMADRALIQTLQMQLGARHFSSFAYRRRITRAVSTL